jgi:hypothetical protein
VELNMKSKLHSVGAACACALLGAGCANLPGMPRGDLPTTTAGAPAEEISFSVTGEHQPDPEKCFFRLEAGYPQDIARRQVGLDLEFEMPSEDRWIGISFYEGIIVEVPDASPVGKPGRGEPHRAEIMHNFLMETFNLRCELLRAKVVVTACDPAPCPGLVIDGRANLFPLELVDNSPR